MSFILHYANKLYALLVLLAVLLFSFWSMKYSNHVFDWQFFLIALLIGCLAQLIDGALGMAYGITSSTFLLSYGATPATASAATHFAEIFTTAASGISHIRRGNFDKALFLKIALPGVIGAILGVIFITQINGKAIRPFIAAYLFLTGVYIFLLALEKIKKRNANQKTLTPIALLGGFLDSVGGGGWGPFVTPSLISQGQDPHKTIGTVNSVEFFVTLASGFSFILFLGIQHYEAMIGLILGGLLAAPFGASLMSIMPKKFLMLFVAFVICGLSLYNIIIAF